MCRNIKIAIPDSENANQPPSFVVSTKSMLQLVSTGDIIGRVHVIYPLVFVDIVVLLLQDNHAKNSSSWVLYANC